MVWEGVDVIKGGRTLLGATNPRDSAPGTIRGDFATCVGRNIIHGSDAPESARNEISFWFKESELVDWTPSNDVSKSPRPLCFCFSLSSLLCVLS